MMNPLSEGGDARAVRAKCSVYIATSLDGFISRSDGSIDWLIKAQATVPAGEDCGYKQFMATVDGLVMGRNTFEQVLSFDAWPYHPTPVVVMSRRTKQLPPNMPATASVSLTDEQPVELVRRLSAGGKRHLYIDGGLTIQSFLAARLIDEITITTIPILLGSGKPLFGPSLSSRGDTHLVPVATQAYDFGFVQTKYRVIDNQEKEEGDGDDVVQVQRE